MKILSHIFTQTFQVFSVPVYVCISLFSGIFSHFAYLLSDSPYPISGAELYHMLSINLVLFLVPHFHVLHFVLFLSLNRCL
jgi:hypothetical protein